MRRILTTLLIAGVVVAGAVPAHSQGKRTDVMWARQTTNAITLNGILSEPDWAKADSIIVRYGKENGIPGSGYKIEAGVLPNDSTYAVIKLLVVGNQMYMGAEVKDKSVGGSKDYNRFDGFLMALKDKGNAGAPKPPLEYLYSWWYPTTTDPQPAGQGPSFIGQWGNNPPTTPRTAEQIANWDAVTVVHGQSNNDAIQDTGYTVEMRFNLATEGYDVTRVQGDIVEWNVSIYDCDWFWPIDNFHFSSFRTWFQSPWGNTNWYDEVHIYSKPSVTTTSGPVPFTPPEVIVPNASTYAAPVINGTLTEPVWAASTPVHIKYGDAAIRASYPGVGPFVSGQFQPAVNGGTALVIDPGDADFKMFVKGTRLYLGFDVRDQFVQYNSVEDRFDGFKVTINDRVTKSSDQTLLGRKLTFQVAANGTATALDYLLTLKNAGQADVAIALKAGTTVDTLGQQADTGYTAEMWVDLTALGYPADLGDKVLFIGVLLFDGDSLTPYTDSYATRTWWFREIEGNCCPAWAYMSNAPVTAVGDPTPLPPVGYELLGSFPNPAVMQTVRYSLLEPSLIELQVYDISGRLLDQRNLGLQPAGVREVKYDARPLSNGLYLYQIKVTDPTSGALRVALPGRLVVDH